MRAVRYGPDFSLQTPLSFRQDLNTTDSLQKVLQHVQDICTHLSCRNTACSLGRSEENEELKEENSPPPDLLDGASNDDHNGCEDNQVRELELTQSLTTKRLHDVLEAKTTDDRKHVTHSSWRTKRRKQIIP